MTTDEKDVEAKMVFTIRCSKPTPSLEAALSEAEFEVQDWTYVAPSMSNMLGGELRMVTIGSDLWAKSD